jgi:hypothetical protein
MGIIKNLLGRNVGIMEYWNGRILKCWDIGMLED